VSQADLLKMLVGVGTDGHASMDCSIVPSKKIPDLWVVSSVDFFTPLVEDPYLQGRIAACNVLSDMYSMGIDEIDNVLMTIAASNKMDHKTMIKVTEVMMKGFVDICREAGTDVTGGQTVRNPWPIIGGVAKSVLKEEHFIRPRKSVPGDVLVLTKPIGTQLSVNMRQWLRTPPNNQRDKMLGVVSEDDVNRGFSVAQAGMGRLNRVAAKLMHKYGSHGATDVTGFGLLGHCQNLAENMEAPVRMVIDRLPCIKGTSNVAKAFPGFKLLEGYSAETSGGLLLTLPSKEAAEGYCRDIEAEEGWPAWIIGSVEAPTSDDPKQQRTAVIADDVQVIEV